MARGAALNPSLEPELLTSASRGSVRELKDKVRRIENASRDQHEKRRKSQYFSHWNGTDGMKYGRYCLLPENEAVFLGVHEKFRDQIFAEARKAARRDPNGVYQAEALVAMAKAAASGGGSNSSSPVKVVTNLRLDYSALMANYVQGDEVCEIVGVGPISLTTAKMLLEDCLLNVIVTKGNDVLHSFHAGVNIPAWVRTLVTERDTHCVVPGCDQTRNLEIHHYRVNRADGGPAHPTNLCRVCPWHHFLVTHRGFRIDGQAGNWQWLTPDDEQPPVDLSPIDQARAQAMTPQHAGTDPPTMFG